MNETNEWRPVMSKKIWSMQLHPDNANAFPPEKLLRILNEYGVIGIGDDNMDTDRFKNKADVGDHVLVRSGGVFVALVEITGPCTNNDHEDDLCWFPFVRKIKILSYDPEKYAVAYRNKTKQEPENGLKIRGSTFQQTNCEFVRFWISELEKEEPMKASIEMVKRAHNVILSGAPGTGKTYFAKQMALQMILGRTVDAARPLSDAEKKAIDEQLHFVQFHPSYDYTDFVEGLRPIQGIDGQMGFKRQDGAFKKLCKAAIAAEQCGGVDNFDEVWSKFTSYLEERHSFENPLELTISGGKSSFKVFLNSRGNLSFVTSGTDKVQGSLTKANIRQYYVSAPTGDYWKCYFVGVLSYLEDEKNGYGLKPYVAGKKVDPKARKPFVMIIDEINRGDISKIFGELFYAIDKGYRGVRGCVNTQYQNLIEKDDPFHAGFYVPENVYVIGTMNDIDRNVESMDFAIRRRFTWKEVEPEDRFDAMWADADGLSQFREEAERRMTWLNKVIAGFDGLGKAFQIGPSYFTEIASYRDDTDPFGRLWEYHLEPLLREYLRGVPESETAIGKLRAAYESNHDGDPSNTADVESSEDRG